MPVPGSHGRGLAAAGRGAHHAGMDVSTESKLPAAPGPPSLGEGLHRPPQFRLRTLLLIVTLLACLAAGMASLGPAGAAVLAWVALLIAAHVFGNAWGTRARQASDRQRAMETATGRAAEPATAPASAVPRPAVGSTRLGARHRLGWPMPVLTAVGAVTLGAAGSVALALTPHEKMSWLAVAVGGVSSAVVGGFLGYLCGSFLATSTRAWNEAARHAAAPRRRWRWTRRG